MATANKMAVNIRTALLPDKSLLDLELTRSIINATHNLEGPASFWSLLKSSLIMESNFSMWKVCQLIHKVVSEGHENVLKESLTRKGELLKLIMFGFSEEPLRDCISAYCEFLLTKLRFHEKNVKFPGSLEVNFAVLEKEFGDNIDHPLELCVDIVKYLQDLLKLQSHVFTSMEGYTTAVLDNSLEWLVAPLIDLIYELDRLFDHYLNILAVLHQKLSNRERLIECGNTFQELYIKIKDFYDNLRPFLIECNRLSNKELLVLADSGKLRKNVFMHLLTVEKTAAALEEKDVTATLEKPLQLQQSSNADEITNVMSEAEDNEASFGEQRYKKLFFEILKRMEMLPVFIKNDAIKPNFNEILKLMDGVDIFLTETGLAYKKIFAGDNALNDLRHKSVLTGYSFIRLHEQCLRIHNVDIVNGKDIFFHINCLKPALIRFYQLLINGTHKYIEHLINDMKTQLQGLRQFIAASIEATTLNIDSPGIKLTDSNHISGNTVDDFIQVDSELKEDAKALRTEVAMLSGNMPPFHGSPLLSLHWFNKTQLILNKIDEFSNSVMDAVKTTQRK